MDLANDWTEDLDALLEKIRLNATEMTHYHAERYINMRSYLKWFRIPTIFMATLGIFTSQGLSEYLEQRWVNLINTGLAIATGLINSIELFLGVQRSMETELSASKEFYVLSTDIYKMLSLATSNRMVSGKSFLDDKYSHYIKLVQNSSLADNHIVDRLIPIPVVSLDDTRSRHSGSLWTRASNMFARPHPMDD